MQRAQPAPLTPPNDPARTGCLLTLVSLVQFALYAGVIVAMVVVSW